MNLNHRTTFLLLTLCISLAFKQDARAQTDSAKQHWGKRELLESVALVRQYDTASKRWTIFGSGAILDLDSSDQHIYFVSNRHILNARDSLRIIVYHYYQDHTNTITLKTVSIPIYTRDTSRCIISKKYDIALYSLLRVPAASQYTPTASSRFFTFDQLNYAQSVEFYGFPLFESYGFDNSEFIFPICRTGTLAYFVGRTTNVLGREDFVMHPGMFLIDGVSISGNSGGPVFVSIPHTGEGVVIGAPNIVRSDYFFAGIISGHLPAPIAGTNAVENADLAYAYSVDIIQRVRTLRE